MKRILHIDGNHPLLKNQLEAAGFINDDDFTSSKEEIELKIHQYDGVIIRSRFKIDKVFLDKAVNLKFIARVGAGLESIDCDYASQKGVSLIAAPEGNRNAVAEHALGMLLSLFNNLNRANAEVKAGKWLREPNRGHELDGKTVGIIGYGNMGKAFAKKLRGFDVKVLCYDILPNVGDANAQQVPLVELQEQADVLSLHIPWTPETDKMVDACFINQFKKPFWLINTARGKSLVTADLVTALQTKKVLGAGLDVLEFEKLSFESFAEDDVPQAFKDLIGFENVILSPHIAGWTFESHAKLSQTIVDKILLLYKIVEPKNEKYEPVKGIGGFFIKSKNPKKMYDWYSQYLGLNIDDYGTTFWWNDKEGNTCSTQWSVFKEDTTYFEPSEKQFMQNFRVKNLEFLLDTLKNKGVTIVGDVQSFEYGKFAWILDCDQNKIELWEPIDSVFL